MNCDCPVFVMAHAWGSLGWDGRWKEGQMREDDRRKIRLHLEGYFRFLAGNARLVRPGSERRRLVTTSPDGVCLSWSKTYRGRCTTPQRKGTMLLEGHCRSGEYHQSALGRAVRTDPRATFGPFLPLSNEGRKKCACTCKYPIVNVNSPIVSKRYLVCDGKASLLVQ